MARTNGDLGDDPNVVAHDFATGQDVVSYLTDQHQHIKELFRDVVQTRGVAREEAFTRLRRMLAVHEAAEEEIVHPKARETIEHGAQVIDERLEEEAEAKRALAKMEALNVDSTAFEKLLRQLHEDVLAHAEAEERDEFAPLAAVLGPDQLAKMRRAAQVAEALAPTRPHPGVQSQTANMLVGPFASMLDHVRDALVGKTAQP